MRLRALLQKLTKDPQLLRAKTLAKARQDLYPYTRPAAAAAAALSLAHALANNQKRRTDPIALHDAQPAQHASRLISDAAVALVAAAGLRLALVNSGGFGWVAHWHERIAWRGALASLAASAVCEAGSRCWRLLDADADANADAATRVLPPHLLVGPAAALLLSATVAERLGGAAGAVAFPCLFLVACADATAAIAYGDGRLDVFVQQVTLPVLLALHCCPPTHTLTARAVASLLWFAAAALLRVSALPGESRWDAEAANDLANVLIAIGTASLISYAVQRRPICLY
jgi:hypothetical protein